MTATETKPEMCDDCNDEHVVQMCTLDGWGNPWHAEFPCPTCNPEKPITPTNYTRSAVKLALSAQP